MAKYALTTEAQHSLEEIKAYSVERFGKKQTTLYLKGLRDRFGFLANNPRLGKERADIFSGWSCYSYFEGSHTIYYEIVSPKLINIIDVLHQSMEPQRHLLGEP